MAKVVVTAKTIHCIDPQDPRRDEIYFITSSENGSHVTKTRNKIGRGTKTHDLVLYQDDKYDRDRNSPIIITMFEERGIRDDSELAAQFEDLAKRGVKYGKKLLKKKFPIGGVIVSVGGWLLDNVISLCKHIFQDTPLGTKIVPFPVNPEAGKNQVFNYLMNPKSAEFPTYEYKIDIEVSISGK